MDKKCDEVPEVSVDDIPTREQDAATEVLNDPVNVNFKFILFV